MLTGIDCAYPNWSTFPDTDVILGYLGGGNQAREWIADDWEHAKQKRWAPIFVPGVGQTPQAAAQAVIPQLRALELPAGCLLALDREANRDDLDGPWVNQFRGLIETGGWHVLGYTSEGTAIVYSGWAYRWISIPQSSPPESVAPYSGVQWSIGSSYDYDVFLEDLPFANTPQVSPPPTPIVKDDDDMAGPVVVTVTKGSNWEDVKEGQTWIIWPNGTRTGVFTVDTRTELTEQYGKLGEWDARTVHAIPKVKA